MANIRTQKRRRRENKTDYKLRKGLLESLIPRVVIRRTNKYFIVQAVESDEAKDEVLFGVTSKDLLKNGWDEKYSGSLKSISAGYLTGLLFAKKVKSLKLKTKFVVDLGMARTLSGSRVFSVVKGLVDGGLDINADEKVFPLEGRLNGEHMGEDKKKMIVKVRENIK